MKFGLPMVGLSPRHYPEVARAAEENGFESLWMPEHLMLPAQMPPTYPYSESGLPPISSDTPLYDPWVVLGSVATVTETIRLSTYVYVLPLRHPFITARSVVTLDLVSNGRVTLGVGAGWLEEEFVASGQQFSDRGRRMEEAIEIIRRLWRDDVTEHHGEFYDLAPMKFQPKPVQKPSIPIEIGGHSRAALQRAGRLGDGWVEVGSGNLGTLGDRLRIVMAARRSAGREHEPFEISSGLGTDPDKIRRCEDLGVTRVIVGPRSDPRFRPKDPARLRKEDFVDWCQRFADEVIDDVGRL
jgi:probable F420-dependent oxidoreductase